MKSSVSTAKVAGTLAAKMATDVEMKDTLEVPGAGGEQLRNYLSRFALVEFFGQFKGLSIHELAAIANNHEELTKRGVPEGRFSDFKTLYEAYEEDRTSRFGAMKDVLGNLRKMNVLIIGCRGVGVETAKNLILTGPKSVTIWDPAPVGIADLGANFYLRKEDVGNKTRAQACLKDLQTLNSRVDVQVWENNALPDDFLKKFQSIVVTEFMPRTELFRINQVARTNGGQFIWAQTSGITASIFADYGPKHTVNDPDGIPTQLLVAESISSEGMVVIGGGSTAIVDPDTGDKSFPHGMDDGDEVQLDDLEGYADDGKKPIEELNGKVCKIKRIYKKLDGGKRNKNIVNQLTLVLPDGEEWSQYARWKAGGSLSQVKQKKEMEFLSLGDSLTNCMPPGGNWAVEFFGPQMPDQDKWQNKNYGKDIHLAIAAVLDFQTGANRFPRLHDAKDAQAVADIAKKINEERKAMVEKGGKATFKDNLDFDKIKKYALYFQVELTGFCAFLGGMAAQEICKKGGKYTPVHQWLHTEDQALIGDEVPSDATPRGTRYDHQIAVFGQAFQTKMSNQNIFLVGCGALGCEYLKGLSLLGVGTGPKGKITVTDMDCIEVSNLSRQFLFRSEHVGKAKSTVGAETARAFNPGINVEPLEEKVWEGTEDLFNDNFWENLTLCWNALDNVHARKYTDGKCLWYGKPLLESGTMGTMTNSEIVLPYKTKSYQDGVDPEPDGIAMCTLRSFPHLILHCIEWSRVQFSELFELFAESFNTLIEDKDKFFEQLDEGDDDEQDSNSLEILQKVKRLVDAQLEGVNFQKCVELAFSEFTMQYRDRIADLVYLFPEDAVNKDKDGNVKGPFWTGHKRFPNVAKFDEGNKDHMDYLHSVANLFAFMFKVPQFRDRAKFDDLVKSYNLKAEEWTPKPWLSAADIEEKKKEDGDDEKEDAGDNDATLAKQKAQEDLENFLKNVDTSKLKPVEVADFEKDDDTNFHIDFITICANMRAYNYRLKPATRHKCKVIAGKIIAALATTTAMITGLVEIEFYKLMLGLQYVHQDKFYNANINLAVPEQTQFFAPDAAEQRKESEDAVEGKFIPYPPNWTNWDKLEINPGKDMTIQELVDSFPKLFWGITPTMLYKYGLTGKDVKEGKGKPLFSDYTANPQLNMAKMMVGRANCPAHAKKNFQKIIDTDAKLKAQHQEIMNSRVSERYFNIYGEQFDKSRKYVVLGGAFENEDGDNALLPYIKYVFKT